MHFRTLRLVQHNAIGSNHRVISAALRLSLGQHCVRDANLMQLRGDGTGQFVSSQFSLVRYDRAAGLDIRSGQLAAAKPKCAL